MAPHTVSFSRPRVKKACDRCKVKKCKCDGARPCSRCKDMNSVCQFSGRKPYQNKVHPKGYVELLERQHEQCVAGLRVMYKWLRAGKTWANPLDTEDGHPRTHDLLLALNILDSNDPKIQEVGPLTGQHRSSWCGEPPAAEQHYRARDSVISTSDDSVLSEVESMNGKALPAHAPLSFGPLPDIRTPLQAHIQGREQAHFMSPSQSNSMPTFSMETAHNINDAAALPWTWSEESSESALGLQLGGKDPWLGSSYDTSVSTAHIMMPDPTNVLDANAHFGSVSGADSDWNDNLFNAPSHFPGTGYMQYMGIAT